MSEIKIRIGRNSVKKPAVAQGPQPIPSHVRQLHISRKLFDVTVQKAETGKLGRFGAALIEGLQAEADAEKRRPAGNGGEKRIAQPACVERIQKGGPMAHARENQAGRRGDFFWPIGGADLRSEVVQSARDGGNVACAIIDERGDHSSSLVLGRTSRRRLSRETANRSARANALNNDST